MSKKPRIEFRPQQSKKLQEFSTQRYIGMGAVLGVYLGWQFRPQREPSLYLAIFISVLISLLILVLPTIRDILALAFPRLKTDTGPFLDRLKQMPINLVQYFLIMLFFEGRHLVLDWGGRGAVIAVGAIAGAIFGYWFKVRRERFGF